MIAAKRVEIVEAEDGYVIEASLHTSSRQELSRVLGFLFHVPAPAPAPAPEKSPTPENRKLTFGGAAIRREDVRTAVIERLAGGPIMQQELTAELSQRFGMTVDSVRAIIYKMKMLGQVAAEDAGRQRQRLSLPTVKVPDEPATPMEPLGPEQVVLAVLKKQGPRMRESLFKELLPYMPVDGDETPEVQASTLLDGMLKSGMITSTKSGRIAAVEGNHG